MSHHLFNLCDPWLPGTGYPAHGYSTPFLGAKPRLKVQQALGSPFPSPSANTILPVSLTGLASDPSIFNKCNLSPAVSSLSHSLLNYIMHLHGFLLVTQQQPVTLSILSQNSQWTLNQISFLLPVVGCSRKFRQLLYMGNSGWPA